MQAQPVQAQARPGAPAAPAAPGISVTPSQLGTSPRANYLAMRERREVLGDQMSRLIDRRTRVAQQLSEPRIVPATKEALEQHMHELNIRIVDLEKQLHASDAEVAAAAGVPGARAPEPRPNNSGPDED